jgi:outer membrane protein assembly factor BamA
MHLLLIAAFLAVSPPDDTPAADTRVAKIQRERDERAKHLGPEEPPRGEQILISVEKNPIFRALFENPSGFRLRIGGLVTGSGFAIGPEYYRPDLHNGDIVVRAGASGSLRLYHRVDAQVAFPHLASDHLYFDVYAAHRNYPSINYYGPGPGSTKSGRTDFRLEDTAYDFTAAVKPVSRLKVGITGGYLQVNVGPGTDERLTSTEKVYSPALAPGIDRQSDFIRYGPMIQFDYRDRPGDPHKGGNYIASYTYYDDRTLNTGNHRKLYAEAQQYIPFFNEKRVIALRAKTELGYRNTNQVIPFYLQPTLGGSEDLRGFRPFRFYDNNLMVINGEYRWEVMTGFDMALFADAGKVFHRHSDLDFTALERSFGFGLRFSSRTNVFMRIDTGFSREGFQVWFKFGNVF